MNDVDFIFYELYDGDFKKKYKSAYKALEKNEFVLNMLIKTYNDQREIEFIKMSNDYLNIAPAYAWVISHKEHLEKKYPDKKIDPETKKAIGAFFAWIMQYDPSNNISIKSKKTYEISPLKQSLRTKDTFDIRHASLFI